MIDVKKAVRICWLLAAIHLTGAIALGQALSENRIFSVLVFAASFVFFVVMPRMKYSAKSAEEIYNIGRHSRSLVYLSIIVLFVFLAALAFASYNEIVLFDLRFTIMSFIASIFYTWTAYSIYIKSIDYTIAQVASERSNQRVTRDADG